MGYDISKTTVFVLLILTILVSVLGTWVMLESSTAPTVVQMPDHPTAHGYISLEIQQPPEPVVTTGLVTLDIKKGGE